MAIAMELPVPMRVGKFFGSKALVMALALCSVAQDAPLPAGQSPPQSSSPTKARRSVHHIQIPVEDSQPEELTRAEDAIEKRDFVTAEPLLRKLTDREPTNYVAWFDLGFVQNALGKLDGSIAAYRKSVAAKPDVFESNLNLGLQLAKSGQPEAEQFLRAATQLKPTSHVAEGQYRAWLSLAQVLEKHNFEQALSAYHQAAILQPQEAEPHLAAGHLLEQENKFSDAEREYKQALA